MLRHGEYFSVTAPGIGSGESLAVRIQRWDDRQVAHLLTLWDQVPEAERVADLSGLPIAPSTDRHIKGPPPPGLAQVVQAPAPDRPTSSGVPHNSLKVKSGWPTMACQAGASAVRR
jgi:hypothetical protein